MNRDTRLGASQHWHMYAAGVALLAVLAQGSGFGCGKKNPATGTQQPKTELPPAEVPERSAPAANDVPDLVAPGALTLAEIGAGDQLKSAETRALLEEILVAGLTAPDIGDRYLSIDGLAVAPWEYAKSRLITAADDKDYQVVMAAVSLLAMRADESLVGLLERFVSWDDFWLDQKGGHPAAVRARRDFDADRTPIEALARLKNPAVKDLIHQKLTDTTSPSIPIQGMRLADRWGAKDYVDELGSLWNGADLETVRFQAARILYRAGINKEQNEKLLRSGLDPMNLASTAIAAGVARDFEKADWAPEIKAVADSEVPMMAALGIRTQGALDLPLDVARVTAMLKDPGSREGLINKTDEWASPELLPALIEAVEQQESDYFILLLGLQKLGWPEAIPRLWESAQEKDAEGLPSARAVQAFNALAEVRDPSVIPHLMAVLDDPDQPSQRHYAALEGLALNHGVEALPSVVRYARNYREAQPGIAAFAAGVALHLLDPAATTTEDLEKRVIWPLPPYGRFTALYPQRTIDQPAPAPESTAPVGGGA